MLTFLLAISVLLSLFSAFLYWQTLEQKKIIRQILAREDMDEIGDDPELVLTVKVRDPISVAKKESRSARFLADHLPVMVSKMVYQEVMKELERELAERQIDVDMQIEYR
ncbi:hypothetical protein ACFQGA_11660 [Marinobacter koreensis]|uniref:Uncharacterized protein n=1 Tax=Marinobacter koreensis TaxID=335974 RepID=A0ABW0RHS5_9GAMM|nr:hypothetical protein [Marinobacter koreensis]MCK7548455.1 hypothetical protein [Marinobacter koreensis]